MMLPTMNEVSEKLRIKYDQAVHSKVILSSKQQKAELVDLENHKKIHPGKLIYFNNSPDYCKANSKYDIAGITGRKCTMNTNCTSSSYHCSNLCCGQGEEQYTVTINKPCNCRFVWCCEVKCHYCSVTKTRHRCKSKH